MHTRWEMDRAEDDRTRSKEITSDELKTILITAVRRHMNKPKMKADRIAKIVRSWKNNRFEYTVTTVGKNIVVLH